MSHIRNYFKYWVLLFSLSAQASQFLEVPFDASVELYRDRVFFEDRTPEVVVQTFSFDLPTDTTYSFFSCIGTQRTSGIFSSEVSYIPSKDAVKRVEVKLTAKRSSVADWALFWEGPLSSIQVNLKFKFTRHPSQDEVSTALSSEIASQLKAVGEIEDGAVEMLKSSFNRQIFKYGNTTEISKDFVAATAYFSFKAYSDLMSSRKTFLIDLQSRAASFPELLTLTSVGLSTIDVRIKNMREWFRPIASNYGLNYEEILDTVPVTLPPEPGGTDAEYVAIMYKKYLKRDPDEIAKGAFERMAFLQGRVAVRNALANTDGAFVIKLFDEYHDQIPDSATIDYWCNEVQKVGRTDVQNRIILLGLQK